ncbi:hypothetical protein [Gordonia rhizosphera]|uniref:Uncharacterized protein n=1 Tax=Gordonia rhizosphera NBRC 16068 TaxID=1108045 RepID=K6W1E8_9ACTN|nr:hypothetical protein [Gordonia rhizosphera]GAB92995.1 hypothetical protein GORHZ_200_00320 [Gordonia rhizosphera NBRC 16068]
MFDIFRSHKEVVVADDPESILEAVNDRAITRLLVDDVAEHPADVLPDTRASAARRIQTVLAYRPSGRVADADVTVTGNDVSEHYVRAVMTDLRDSPRRTLQPPPGRQVVVGHRLTDLTFGYHLIETATAPAQCGGRRRCGSVLPRENRDQTRS